CCSRTGSPRRARTRMRIPACTATSPHQNRPAAHRCSRARGGICSACRDAIVLVRSDPRDVPRIVELRRASYRKMIQDLWWAAGYNIVALPLAAGVLAPWGIVVNPAVGAVLMSFSTIAVALNAQLLRR